MIKEYKSDKTGFGIGLIVGLGIMIVYAILAPNELYGTDSFLLSLLGIVLGSAVVVMFFLRLKRQSVQLHENEVLIFKGKQMMHQIPLDQTIEAFQILTGWGRNKQIISYIKINGEKVMFHYFSANKFKAMIHEIQDHQVAKYPRKPNLIKGIQSK